MDKDDVRLLLGVGVIVVSVAVSTWSTNRRLDELSAHIDDTGRRLADVQLRLDAGFAAAER